MKLSISNIGWPESSDRRMYAIMSSLGFQGLEVAPTRIFSESPYEKLDAAYKWKETLRLEYGIFISSMQSIWYGYPEKIFGSDEERTTLIGCTKKSIDFAETIGCENLVFGCPKNRSIPENGDPKTAVRFFKELGDYADQHHTVIAMEANPPIYHTNFLNTTQDALDFIETVDSKGFQLNLDTGTMIQNGESITIFHGKEHRIHHVHISEPGLQPIQKRKLHLELAAMLQRINYRRFVSIEVSGQNDIGMLMDMMGYVKEIFG